MKQNPDLMKQFASATANTMAQNGNDKTGMAGMFSGMFQGAGKPPPAKPTSMKGPSNLEKNIHHHHHHHHHHHPRKKERFVLYFHFICCYSCYLCSYINPFGSKATNRCLKV